jgi:hypothetical protein
MYSPQAEEIKYICTLAYKYTVHAYCIFILIADIADIAVHLRIYMYANIAGLTDWVKKGLFWPID